MGKYDEAEINFEKCHIIRNNLFGLNSYKIAEVFSMKGIIFKEKNLFK
jgi:hypothetical protein